MFIVATTQNLTTKKRWEVSGREKKSYKSTSFLFLCMKAKEKKILTGVQPFPNPSSGVLVKGKGWGM